MLENFGHLQYYMTTSNMLNIDYNQFSYFIQILIITAENNWKILCLEKKMKLTFGDEK